METPAVWCLQLSNQQDHTLKQNASCKPADESVINSLKHSKLHYNTEGREEGTRKGSQTSYMQLPHARHVIGQAEL